MSNNLSIVVILGPTASGKSKLAVKLAKEFHGEIISTDSRQVYKDLNIGTEKITKKEMKGVKHYLIDIVAPQKIYTVTQYQKAAKKIIRKILDRKKIPIICGGTGFYIDTLIYDYRLPAVPPQKKLRKELEKKTNAELFQQLKKLDPARAKNIDKNNSRRLIRALEIILKTGKPISEIKKQSPYRVLKIGLKKSPKELCKLINQRLNKALKKGLIQEVKKLHQKGLSWKRLEDLGMEYRLVFYYLRGLISYQQLLDQMPREIYHYAQRQMTWFKKDKNIHWIKNYSAAEKLIKNFLLTS